MQYTAGTVVGGKYRIESVLGEGGMGIVYRATDTVLQRPVALKLILPGIAMSEQMAERFKREAMSLARVRHPGVVQIFEVGVQDGSPWMALELLEGEPLDQTLERGPLSPEQVVWLADEALQLLDAVHAEGIVHRDLKPSNFYLAKDRLGRARLKLLDFGVAHQEAEAGKLTGTGQSIGTPWYMSPEQLKATTGVPLDARSDLYSLGVVLYECLSGKLPHAGTSLGEVTVMVFTELPAPLASIAPGAPIGLVQWVESALHRERDQRPACASAMLESLRSLASSSGIAPGASQEVGSPALVPAGAAMNAPGQVQAVQVQADPVQADQVQADQVQAVQVQADQVQAVQVQAVQVQVDQVQADAVSSASGDVAPEPLHVREVLSKSFEVVSNNTIAVVLAATVSLAPVVVLRLLFSTLDPFGLFLFGLLQIVLTAWCQGAASVIVLSDLAGRKSSPMEAIGRGTDPALKLLIAGGLTTLGTFFGGLLFIIPGLIVWALFSLTIPVMVVERLGVIASIRRSVQLSKGARWRTLLFAGLVGLVVELPMVVLQAIVAGGLDAPPAPLRDALFDIPGIVVFSVGIAIIYATVRSRREGGDVVSLSRSSE